MLSGRCACGPEKSTPRHLPAPLSRPITFKAVKMVTFEPLTRGFRTAVHKPMGDVTKALSIFNIQSNGFDSTK